MHGSNENHDIVLINDAARPAESQRALTTWTSDDLRPVWSPDGRKIAFYSNYNAAGDPRAWSLAVIAADGSDPAEGDGLAACVVATDIIPDVEAGPAWMPDSNRIVFVKNDRQEYNPLYVADVGPEDGHSDQDGHEDEPRCRRFGRRDDRVPRPGQSVGPDLYHEAEGVI